MRQTAVVILGGFMGWLTGSACRSDQVDLEARGATLEQTAVVDRFRVGARADLEELDSRIQRLMARADSTGGRRRADLHVRIQEFQDRSGHIEDQLRRLTWTDALAWQRDTGTINAALEALRGDVIAALATGPGRPRAAGTGGIPIAGDSIR
ncbi:MAG TPA: hypothetical protein VD793_05300 [Gemmatimonadales bacterium]|nr:hypothetical protein [Gemmatimonadales bacterium]